MNSLDRIMSLNQMEEALKGYKITYSSWDGHQVKLQSGDVVSVKELTNKISQLKDLEGQPKKYDITDKMKEGTRDKANLKAQGILNGSLERIQSEINKQRGRMLGFVAREFGLISKEGFKEIRKHLGDDFLQFDEDTIALKIANLENEGDKERIRDHYEILRLLDQLGGNPLEDTSKKLREKLDKLSVTEGFRELILEKHRDLISSLEPYIPYAMDEHLTEGILSKVESLGLAKYFDRTKGTVAADTLMNIVQPEIAPKHKITNEEIAREIRLNYKDLLKNQPDYLAFREQGKRDEDMEEQLVRDAKESIQKRRESMVTLWQVCDCYINTRNREESLVVFEKLYDCFESAKKNGLISDEAMNQLLDRLQEMRKNRGA